MEPGAAPAAHQLHFVLQLVFGGVYFDRNKFLDFSSLSHILSATI